MYVAVLWIYKYFFLIRTVSADPKFWITDPEPAYLDIFVAPRKVKNKSWCKELNVLSGWQEAFPGSWEEEITHTAFVNE